MTIKVTKYNPIDFMESDEEIVEYLVACIEEDPTLKVYERAVEWLCEAKGLTSWFRYHVEVTRRIYAMAKQNNGSEISVSPALAPLA